MSDFQEYRPRKRARSVDDSESGVTDDTPRPVAMGVGAAGGALGALAFSLWEASVIARAGLPMPAGDLLVMSLAIPAILGGVFGLFVGAFRRTGWSFALAWTLVYVAWLLSGKAGLAFAGPSTAWLAAAIFVPGALGVGIAATAADVPEGLKAGGAAGLFVLVAVGLPVNQHLLGNAASGLAAVVDGGAFVAALLAGTIVGLFGPAIQRLGAAGPLLAAYVLGLLALLPPMLRAEPAWPVATSDEHPPIVLIVVDTLRADHLGAYGYDRPTSPKMDAFARRAIVYTDATAAAPWTLPSVAALLTGQVPNRTGAGVNLGQGSTDSPLRPDAKLLPAHLAEAGYTSAAVVTNPFLTAAFGFHRGFDRYDDAPSPAAMPAGIHPLFAMGIDVWPMYRGAESITDRAIGFVQAQEHKSWFLFVHYMDVHGPHHPKAEDRAAVGTSGQGNLVDDYDATIHEVDRHLGRLIEALPRNAWVIITSDHGEQLLEKRIHLSSAIPAGTRHGHSMYQEIVHVPLMIAGPGVGGWRVQRPVSLLDVTPTILSLVDLPLPERISGLPLPEIAGGSVPDDRDLYADSVRFGPEQQMVRRGKYKLIRWFGQGVALYDLDAEPEELEEVQAQEQELKTIVRRMEGQLPPVGVSTAEPSPPVGAEVQMLLERLGYVVPDTRSAPATEPAAPE